MEMSPSWPSLMQLFSASSNSSLDQDNKNASCDACRGPYAASSLSWPCSIRFIEPYRRCYGTYYAVNVGSSMTMTASQACFDSQEKELPRTTCEISCIEAAQPSCPMCRREFLSFEVSGMYLRYLTIEFSEKHTFVRSFVCGCSIGSIQMDLVKQRRPFRQILIAICILMSAAAGIMPQAVRRRDLFGRRSNNSQQSMEVLERRKNIVQTLVPFISTCLLRLLP